jgi:hypothetical protein
MSELCDLHKRLLLHSQQTSISPVCTIFSTAAQARSPHVVARPALNFTSFFLFPICLSQSEPQLAKPIGAPTGQSQSGGPAEVGDNQTGPIPSLDDEAKDGSLPPTAPQL